MKIILADVASLVNVYCNLTFLEFFHIFVVSKTPLLRCLGTSNASGIYSHKQ